ncbi:MAG: hypothetical protein KDI09_22050, partial [Halioglobus sp.]|nr:hypothetical protein [Halioglobus sp.]
SLDFTVTEETRETYDPANTALRSEQLSEDRRSGNGAVAEGVPGALSNQPPETAADGNGAGSVQSAATVNSSRSSTRNFEVDRTVSHVRPQSGTIERLSVAVLVDDSPLEEGGDQQAFSAEEIERFTTLVKEAVGFDAARGDTVVVVNAAFRNAPALDDIEEPPFWENPALRDSLKQVLGALLVLALGFGLVRPLLGKLLAGGGSGGGAYAGGATAELMPAGSVAGSLAAPSFDDKITAARNITGADPARVAQVVRKWVSTDE